MLFGETVAVYCENHTKHTNNLCGQYVEFWYVKVGGTVADPTFDYCLSQGLWVMGGELR
jgi:hypothetical protein